MDPLSQKLEPKRLNERKTHSLQKKQSTPSANGLAPSREISISDNLTRTSVFLSGTDADAGHQTLSSSEHPPISIAITQLTDQVNEEQEALIRQLEHEFIDFSGNAGASSPQYNPVASPEPMSLKEEEEEVQALTQESTGNSLDRRETNTREIPIDVVDADEADPFLEDYASRGRTPTTTTSQQVTGYDNKCNTVY